MATIQGLTITLSRCGLRSQQEDWNTWYDDVHLPDLMSSKAFSTITRWQMVDNNTNPLPRLGFTHLDVGEIAHEDPEEGHRRLGAKAPELRASGRIHPYHFIDDIVTYKTLGRWSVMPEPSPKTRALFVIFNRTNDPAKMDEWNEWLDDTHIPECMDVGRFHAVTRWVKLTPERHRPNHLVLYHIREDDIEAGVQRVIELNRHWEADGHIPAYHSGALSFLAVPAGKWGATGCTLP